MWLKGVELYVFCTDYEERAQRRGSRDLWEVEFRRGRSSREFLVAVAREC